MKVFYVSSEEEQDDQRTHTSLGPHVLIHQPGHLINHYLIAD